MLYDYMNEHPGSYVKSSSKWSLILGFVYVMERRTCIQELLRKLGSGRCTDDLSESFCHRVISML